MSNLLISLIHPTARTKPYPSFPKGWLEACNNFYKNCAKPYEVEYVVVVHQSRYQEFTQNYPFRELTNQWGYFKVVVNNGGQETDNVVCQVNKGFAATSPETKLLLGIMDDSTAPEGWDLDVLKSVPDLDGEYVAQYSTGSPRDADLIVAGAMTRKRYEAVGYCLHPDYLSMYADDDMTRTAKQDGVYVDARHLEFLHMHPNFGRSEWDDIYSNENSQANLLRGITTFNRRKAQGWPKGITT